MADSQSSILEFKEPPLEPKPEMDPPLPEPSPPRLKRRIRVEYPRPKKGEKWGDYRDRAKEVTGFMPDAKAIHQFFETNPEQWPEHQANHESWEATKSRMARSNAKAAREAEKISKRKAKRETNGDEGGDREED